MLYTKLFRNEITRKYIVAFSSLFNNISIVREDSNNNELQRVKVPISFVSKMKFIEKLNEDGDLNKRRTAITLPRLSFEIGSYNYAPDRKISSQRKTVSQITDYTRKYFYTPVPYDIGFTLYLYTKSQEEGFQIIEQILPFFAPDFSVTVKLLDDASDDFKHDIPIVLNSIDCKDTSNGPLDENRQIIWTLEFTLKGYYYGPIRSQGVITNVRVRIYDGEYGEVDPNNFVYQYVDGITSLPSTFAQQENGLISVLKITKNVDYSVVFDVKDITGEQFDLTDWNIVSTIRKNPSSSQVYSFVPTKHNQTTEKGKLTLTLPANVSLPMDNDYYIYDIELENVDGVVIHIYDGLLRINS